MTTLQDNSQVDSPPKDNQVGDDDNEEEEEYDPLKAELQPFKFYMQHENLHEILQKRWFIFFLMVSVVYSYHFVSIILGMN